MPRKQELSIDVTLSVSDETAASCLYLLRMYMRDNPHRKEFILNEIQCPLEGAKKNGTA